MKRVSVWLMVFLSCLNGRAQVSQPFSGIVFSTDDEHTYRNRTADPDGFISLIRDEEEEEEEEEDDPYRGFSFGINLGAYFASKETANFYNGSGFNIGNNPNEVRGYSIYERLTLTPQEINYITTYYNATGFEVPYDSSPLNMRYVPGFMLGLQIKYNFNKDAAIVFNVNSMKLKAVDKFTLRFIGTPAQQNSQQDIRTFQITGSEQRFNFSLGYRQGFEMAGGNNFYIQPGASMLGTQMERNQIVVADRTYDLFIGAANPNQIQAYQPRTDLGFGYYISTGFEFWIKEKYSFDISLGFSRDNVVLVTEDERVWNKWLQASFTL